MLIVTVIFMGLLTGMEFDLFTPSFPELQHRFGLTPFWVEALLSINFAGYCVSLFFIGGLADRYGRKPIILLGLFTFLTGVLLCLATNSYKLFLTGRFLQGIGIAAPAILSFLIIADTYPLKKQQFFMAMLNGIKNASVAAAPVIGSYITLYFHWQGNFIALLMLGSLALIMTLFFIPSYELPHHKQTFPPQSYLQLFQSKPLLLLIVNILFIFVPYWIFVGMSPLLYLKDLKVSLSHFGYYQGVLALVFALGSLLFGLMIRRYDYSQKTMLSLAIQLLIVSFVIISLITLFDGKNPLFITLSFLPFIIAQIIPSTILYPLCINLIPEAKGRVSAIIQGSFLILASVALQLAGYFYHGTYRSIGIIIMFCILMAIITMIFVIRNQEIMVTLGE